MSVMTRTYEPVASSDFGAATHFGTRWMRATTHEEPSAYSNRATNAAAAALADLPESPSLA